MAFKTKERALEYAREYIRARRTAWIVENGPCNVCGTYIDLEVDHRDPSTKSPKLIRGNTGKVWYWPASERLEELKKCQVLCKSCHLEKTKKEHTKNPEHGTRQRWCKGCRCTPCIKDHKIYNKQVYARYRSRHIAAAA
jgi:5-methylcytosine-specific restriction endonuclease McrA